MTKFFLGRVAPQIMAPPSLLTPKPWASSWDTSPSLPHLTWSGKKLWLNFLNKLRMWSFLTTSGMNNAASDYGKELEWGWRRSAGVLQNSERHSVPGPFTWPSVSLSSSTSTEGGHGGASLTHPSHCLVLQYLQSSSHTPPRPSTVHSQHGSQRDP